MFPVRCERQLPRPIEATRRETLQWVARSAPGVIMDRAEFGALLFAGSVQLLPAVQSHLHRYRLSTGRFAVLITLGSAPEGRHSPLRSPKASRCAGRP